MKASSSFLQKRTKKLLFAPSRTVQRCAPHKEKFFGSFFQKRTACLLFCLAASSAQATDWPALRAAYAASPAYDPSAGTTPLTAVIAAAIARQDFRLAATLAEAATVHDMMDLRAHLLAVTAYTHLNDAARAAMHREAAAGLVRAIIATGSGATRASPIRVLAAGEEYALLLSLHLHLRSQTLEESNGHAIEIVTVKHLPDGRISELYFDMDAPFAREISLAAQRK